MDLVRRRYYYSRLLLLAAFPHTSTAAAHNQQNDEYEFSHPWAGDLESDSGSYSQDSGHGSVAPRDLPAISFEVEWPARDCKLRTTGGDVALGEGRSVYTYILGLTRGNGSKASTAR